MYIPNVGARVKLKTLGNYREELGIVPNWQWLRVVCMSGEAVGVEVLDGDKVVSAGTVRLSTIDPPLGYREAKPGEFLFFIPPSKVEEVREWYRSRGGAIRWVSCELGVSRPEMLTPAETDGQPTRPPHWAYVGEPFPVKPEEIGVREETGVTLPVEWFPVCDRCEGTGKVSVASLAKIRKETQKATLTALKSDGRTTLVDDKNVQCWCCDGTGHKERYVQVRVKKHYWGYDLFDAGKEKARKIAAKLGPDVKWDWENWGYGLARLRFYREKIEPFTL